jgi:hypothetical protein
VQEHFVVAEKQCHTGFWSYAKQAARQPLNLEHRVASLKIIVEIDHQSEAAPLVQRPIEDPVVVPPKPLPGLVSIKAQTFVEAAKTPTRLNLSLEMRG